MRALLQRVTRAEVRVEGDVVGSIGGGLLILLGVGPNDTAQTAADLARRTTELRIFRDGEGKTNLDLAAAGGAVLAISQFTLYADTKRGRRPGFTGAAATDVAEELYRQFVAALQALDVTVETGRFGAEMAVDLVNDGPFTIWLDTDDH